MVGLAFLISIGTVIWAAYRKFRGQKVYTRKFKILIAIIVVFFIIGFWLGSGDRRTNNHFRVTEAQGSASNCNEALVINHLQPGNYTQKHKNKCDNICQGEWLDEKAGAVIKEGKDTLNNSGYDPGADSEVDSTDYWVRGACLAGKPEWIIEE